jgi:hypothetical protein
MAVRVSQHRAALIEAAEAQKPSAADDVRRLPTVQALAFGEPPPATAIGAGQPVAAGDDDDERDLAAEPDVDLPGVPSGEELSDEEFYADAMPPDQ